MDRTNIISHGRVPGAKRRVFWEREASEYPSPFNKKVLRLTEKVIRIMEARSIPFAGARILDIGCGAGTFALPLALRGASVTALDFSENMLKRLIIEARNLKIDKLKTLRSSWKKVNICEASLERAFDVVLAAMSTAVETKGDILKMEKCSREWCVYIASGKIVREKACDDILQTLQAPLHPRPDIRNIRLTLEKMGRAFYYDSFMRTVIFKKTPGQITRELSGRLEAAGIKPDHDRIVEVISSCPQYTGMDNVIEYRRRGETGVIAWRLNEKL